MSSEIPAIQQLNDYKNAPVVNNSEGTESKRPVTLFFGEDNADGIEYSSNNYDISDSFDLFDLDEETDVDKILNGIDVVFDFGSSAIGTFGALTQPRNGAMSALKQDKSADSWLIAGINALSYCEKGKEIIRDSLEYQRGGAVVHFDGLGKDYTVSNTEVFLAAANSRYASGDDTKIFQIAVEKALKDIADGNITLSENVPSCIESNNAKSALSGGSMLEIIALLTGKTGKVVDDKAEMAAVLDDFQRNENKDLVLGADILEPVCVKDAIGRSLNLEGPHGYSVKKVTDDAVYLVDPWNSSSKIVLDRNTFAQTFNYLEFCDLSDENPAKQFASKDFTLDC